MKQITLIFIVLALMSSCVNQDNVRPEKVFEGNLHLSTQEDIDKFATKGYTKVTGNLTIGQLYQLTEEVTTINSLKSLSEIEGDLSIWSNTKLSNLNGLESMKNVGGDLVIWYNSNLIEFCGIKELVSSGGISGDIKIENNLENPTIDQIAACR